jgi:hypothetical protein
VQRNDVASRLFAALALCALFVSIAGPGYDHHFGERDPHHAHID